MPLDEPACFRLAPALGAVMLLALAGCDRAPPAPAAVNEAPARSTLEKPVFTSPPPAPDPDDAMAGASYEVGIATGAANRKRALEGCESRPAAERDDCVAAVEADWEVAKSTVEDLRGEQQ